MPYTWSVDSGDRIAEAPGWLLELLASGGSDGKATPPEEWLELVTAGVEEGARNYSVARIAGLLFRRFRATEAELAAELVACWNATRCRPPLEAIELKRTLDSIAAKEMQRRGLPTRGQPTWDASCDRERHAERSGAQAVGEALLERRAARSIYRPSFFSRIRLRYRDRGRGRSCRCGGGGGGECRERSGRGFSRRC
jgi:hypothetical protein